MSGRESHPISFVIWHDYTCAPATPSMFTHAYVLNLLLASMYVLHLLLANMYVFLVDMHVFLASAYMFLAHTSMHLLFEIC